MYLLLTHVVLWPKSQYCKAIILKKKKKNVSSKKYVLVLKTLTCLFKIDLFNEQITFRILHTVTTFYFISHFYLKSTFELLGKILKLELNKFLKLIIDNVIIKSLSMYEAIVSICFTLCVFALKIAITNKLY